MPCSDLFGRGDEHTQRTCVSLMDPGELGLHLLLWDAVCPAQGSANLFWKGQTLTISGFARRITHCLSLLCKSVVVQAAIDCMSVIECGSVPRKLHLQTQAVGQDWLGDGSLPTPKLATKLASQPLALPGAPFQHQVRGIHLSLSFP